MEILRNKTKLNSKLVSMLLLASSLLITLILPAAFAQTELPGYTPMPDRDTWTEVGLSPNFVGVGQEVTVNIMTYPGPSGPTYEAQYLVDELHGGFEGITITIKHPDGSEETYMPIDETLAQVGIQIPGVAQIVGHLQFRYTPTEVGEYEFTASFPGDFYTTDNIYEPGKLSVYYKPSASTKPAILTVQQEKVIESGLLTGWPWSPLPENYWENPVQTDNREWYQISGDWTKKEYDNAASKYNLYSTAPSSPHILWRRTLTEGGLPGGFWGSLPYSTGGYFASTPIIMDGKIYTNGRPGYFECINLRTGEKMWEAPGSIVGGQRIDPAFQTHTQQAEGFIDRWLWGNVIGTASLRGGGTAEWYRYDPYDGHRVQTIANVPPDLSGIKFEDGNPIIWCVQASLSTWNTTLPMKISYCNLIKWDYSKMVSTQVYRNIYSNDWMDGVVWNVSVMSNDQVSVGDNNFRGPNVYPFWGANVVVVKTPNAMQTAVGVDMTTGAIKWRNNNMVLDIDVLTEGIASSPNGPLIKQDGASPNFVAYDLQTGQEIWRASTGELPWSLLPSYEHVYHDGVHFMGSYDGHVYAIDTDTGQRVWQSEYLGEQWETIYGNQPITAYTSVGADGKLYFSTTTIYRMMPRTRFHETVCIDEYTGKFIWRLPIGISCFAIADGYLLGDDDDNQLLYCIGKGKTETTVDAPLTAVPKGTSITIRGTVMDMSPGAPNTPAVADKDMGEWMDYLYGQNATLINNPPLPAGVQVTLTAIVSDGSVIDIGTTTTNGYYGTFAHAWTPPDEGTYEILATFEGSESYWSSGAATAVTVGPAITPAGPIEPEPGLSLTTIAIIAAVAVVAVIIVVVYWVRKTKK